MNIQRPRFLQPVLVAIIVLGSFCSASANDYDNWKTKWDVPPAPALEPEEEHETFRTAPGFDIELAAAEPQVVDPVMVRWDASGRMWVVEMRGYMHDVDGKGEDQPIGKIAVLQDNNNDGYYEDRTVFMDDLVMPRTIALVEGGVLVAEPPHLWYAQDTDGDLQSDRKVEVLDDYAKNGNVEHRENGLRQAIDNWIYNAKSNRRFLFDLKNGEPQIRVEKTRFRGQWGISQDSYGRLYYNTNSNYLRAESFPGNLKQHNYRLSDGGTKSHSVASDQKVYPIRINPGVNRGYKPPTLREDGRLNTTTGVSGQTVYRGDQFPNKFRENAFVPDVAGNVVAFFNMKRNGNSVKAKHVTFDDPEWGKREFMASKDERFRPVNVENGPDGTLYVIDFYRGIIQHETYMTGKYLKKQVLARNLDKPVGLGRIWRVRSTKNNRRSEVNSLRDRSSPELVRLLSHPNGWHRDWAQRLLIRRDQDSVVSPLRSVARNGDEHIARIHAIWTLEGLRKLDKKTIMDALDDPHIQVRKAAARARVNRKKYSTNEFKKLKNGRFQAENGQLNGAGSGSSHSGHTGNGYIDFTKNKGGQLEITLKNVPGGRYNLSVRYAVSSSSRPLKLVANGQTVHEKIPFPNTGGWSSWDTQEVEVDLKQGKNVLVLETTGKEGPNIDYVQFDAVQ